MKKRRKLSNEDLYAGAGPILLAALAMGSGLWLWLHPAGSEDATLRLWSFAQMHLKSYEKVIPQFEQSHPGSTLAIQLVHPDAVTHRLRAAFWADLAVPDLVEVEISSVGSFFRGPSDEIGFVDLKPRLVETGLLEKTVQAIFTPYSYRGAIYGLPKAVCPVMLAYRKDIFDAEGIDLSEVQTWDEFIRIGRRLTRLNQRYMIELSDSHQGQFEILLFQQGGGYFDENGGLILNSDTALKTLLWYIPLVAGPERIGADLGSGRIFTQALEQGYFLAFLCPDWRTKITEEDVPRVSGKMALMPLPSFYPGGRRTSTQGGTMLAITQKTPDKDLAWEAAVALYMDPLELAERYRDTNIVPPLREAWSHQIFDQPRPYWSGQKIGRLLTNLAEETPAQYNSPYLPLAKAKLGQVITACAQRYRLLGDDGFEEFARARLDETAREIFRQMERNPYRE